MTPSPRRGLAAATVLTAATALVALAPAAADAAAPTAWSTPQAVGRGFALGLVPGTSSAPTVATSVAPGSPTISSASGDQLRSKLAVGAPVATASKPVAVGSVGSTDIAPVRVGSSVLAVGTTGGRQASSYRVTWRSTDDDGLTSKARRIPTGAGARPLALVGGTRSALLLLRIQRSPGNAKGELAVARWTPKNGFGSPRRVSRTSDRDVAPQATPAIVRADDGRALAVWEGFHVSGGKGRRTIDVRQVSTTGVPGRAFRVDTLRSVATSVSAAANDDGGTLIAWNDQGYGEGTLAAGRVRTAWSGMSGTAAFPQTIGTLAAGSSDVVAGAAVPTVTEADGTWGVGWQDLTTGAATLRRFTGGSAAGTPIQVLPKAAKPFEAPGVAAWRQLPGGATAVATTGTTPPQQETLGTITVAPNGTVGGLAPVETAGGTVADVDLQVERGDGRLLALWTRGGTTPGARLSAAPLR